MAPRIGADVAYGLDRRREIQELVGALEIRGATLADIQRPRSARYRASAQLLARERQDLKGSRESRPLFRQFVLRVFPDRSAAVPLACWPLAGLLDLVDHVKCEVGARRPVTERGPARCPLWWL